MTLEEEDELAGFLGIHIERTSDHVKLTQKGLAQRVIDQKNEFGWFSLQEAGIVSSTTDEASTLKTHLSIQGKEKLQLVILNETHFQNNVNC